MAYQMQILIAVMTVISVEAYEIKRNVFSNADDTFYRKFHSQNLFLNPFVDKTISLQTSSVIPIRDRTVSQRAFRDMSSKDRMIYSSDSSIFHHQPIKQNSFTVTSFRDKPFFKDTILKNRKMRGEQAVLRDNPFEGQSFTSEKIFEGQPSTYKSQVPFKEQLFTTGTSFKNLFRGQLSLAKQTSFQKQATFVESPSISNSIKFYRDDYIKPVDSYKRYKNIPTSPEIFDGKSTKYVPFSEYLPLNAKMPSVIMHGHNSAMSSAFSGMGKDHSSEASKMELGPILTSASNCNTPVDSSPRTVPSISVSTNQSSIVGHILTNLTTKPSSPVMATSIVPSTGNIKPIYFYATKYGAATLSPTLSELNSNMYAYALSSTPKNSHKINEHDFKLQPLEAPKNIETQSSMLNYILPEEHKSRLKGIHISFADYDLLVKLKHDWPLQQFSQLEISSGYAPSLNGKTKLVSPNTPIAPITWPTEIKSDISTMPPLKFTMTSDSATRNKSPLNTDLPVDFTSIPNSMTSSTSNGISGSITGSISTGIPGSMTMDIPVSIPTLNFDQSLHHVEQLPQTQEARNPWYPTGLLQLGDFSRKNYTLHTGNPAMKSMEPGLAKAGLTSPKLRQPHVPVFAKVSFKTRL